MKYNWHDEREQFDADRKYCVQPYSFAEVQFIASSGQTGFSRIRGFFVFFFEGGGVSFSLLQPATLC